MIKIQGKYNFVNVMIDHFEPELVAKLHKILAHPAFKSSYIAIMPDAHDGKGACIGFTQKINDDTPLIPNVVGVDINCGMLSVNLGNVDIDLESLDKYIHDNVPSGMNVHSISSRRKGVFTDTYKDKLIKTCDKVGCNITRAFDSIGTLGGGNHFIEVGEAPNKDKWVTVHTGSRNFGKCVCDHHQNKARDLMKSMYIGADVYKDLEFLPNGLGAEEYLYDMTLAQDYADMNRLCIVDIIGKYFEKNWNTFESLPEHIHSRHNYIDFEEGIIRKGATPANKGERVVIPFNMRDGIAICTGKGNSKWNYSAPHGAGRIMSRRKAKDTIPLDKYQKDMEGVYTTCVNKATLDEAPDAYKDYQIILDSIEETVTVDFMLKPIYNFKGV